MVVVVVAFGTAFTAVILLCRFLPPHQVVTVVDCIITLPSLAPDFIRHHFSVLGRFSVVFLHDLALQQAFLRLEHDMVTQLEPGGCRQKRRWCRLHNVQDILEVAGSFAHLCNGSELVLEVPGKRRSRCHGLGLTREVFDGGVWHHLGNLLLLFHRQRG